MLLAWLAISSTTVVQAFLLSTLSLRVPELQVVGAILLIAATLFTLWSRLVLGTTWSSRPAVKSGHQLRTDGPYGITRHPIYTGALGMFVGTALIFLIFLPVLVISLAVFLSKISDEEELMAQQFGEQYAEYKQRVPQLIPGVHVKKKRQ
jgi:protein-S-isoprenylcysteine O-methyltransferase Ste14